MVYSVTHDTNPTKAFFTVQNALRKSKILDDITCTTLYQIKKNKICKIRTEINFHPLVQHGVHGVFFYKINDTLYIFLDMSCNNFSQILRKMYKLRAKFPLRPYELHDFYCD